MDAPLVHTPANFGPKRFFFDKLLPNPSCVPNLKLLASTVTEICRGPKFLDASLANPPPILVLNVVFGLQHSVPKWCKDFVAHAHV